MLSTTLVIPCYNEAKRLPRSEFAAFLRRRHGVRLLFANDGSTDDTAQLLHELAQEFPEGCEVLALEKNGGKAEAVRRGCLRAFAFATQAVGYWDADLATPLEEVFVFQRRLLEDPRRLLVMGSRVMMLGAAIQRDPVRHYLGRVFATAAALTLQTGVYDTQCGAKLFRPTPRVRHVFRRPFRTRWLMDVEILARLARGGRLAGMPGLEEIVVEQPLRTWRDVPGSKVKPLDLFKALAELVRLRWEYYRRPAAAQELAEIEALVASAEAFAMEGTDQGLLLDMYTSGKGLRKAG